MWQNYINFIFREILIAVVNNVLYCTNNIPVKQSGSEITRATALYTLLMPNRFQKSSNSDGTFITPLKYLIFIEGNKDKWKTWLSGRHNSLIKADGHQKRDILRILMPHKGSNIQDLTDVVAGQTIKDSSELL